MSNCNSCSFVLHFFLLLYLLVPRLLHRMVTPAATGTAVMISTISNTRQVTGTQIQISMTMGMIRQDTTTPMIITAITKGGMKIIVGKGTAVKII